MQIVVLALACAISYPVVGTSALLDTLHGSQLAIELRPGGCHLRLAPFDLRFFRPCTASPRPTPGERLFLLGTAPRSFGPSGVEPLGPS